MLSRVQLEFSLKFHQLTHEVEIWRDSWSLFFHKLVSALHGHSKVVHKVGNGDGDGT